jgi:hypothetical protein
LFIEISPLKEFFKSVITVNRWKQEKGVKVYCADGEKVDF